MNLLAPLRSLVRLHRRSSALLGRFVLVAGLAAIEIFGRSSTRDVAELLWMPVLALAVAAWLALDRKVFSTLSRWGRAADAYLDAVTLSVPLDLRGKPPIPRRLPTYVLVLAPAMAVAAALLVARALFATTPFRDLVRAASYVLLLAWTALAWAALLLAIALCVIGVALFARAVARVHRGGENEARAAARPWWLAYLVLVTLCVAFAPVWVAPPLVGLVFVVRIAIAAARPIDSPALLWAEERRGVGSYSVHSYLFVKALEMWGCGGLLVLAALGPRALGGAAGDATPISDALGTVTAWCWAFAAVVAAGFEFWTIRRALWRSPERPVPTRVHLAPEILVSARLEQEVSGLFSKRGWTVHWHPDIPQRADVRLRLVERMPPLAGRAPSWPLAVSVAALRAPELLDLIARRDRLQRRRLLLRGLKRILAISRRCEDPKGTGFLLAPHQWVVDGPCRDTEVDDALSPAYPAFEKFIPPAASAYAYEVFARLEVDLIFVEDDVPWRRLQEVLIRLFEHFQQGGGRIEERHLHGIPGVRAILHDYEPGRPLVETGYPEPGYSLTSRARVLDVFRDRGGGESRPKVPAGGEGLLLPV